MDRKWKNDLGLIYESQINEVYGDTFTDDDFYSIAQRKQQRGPEGENTTSVKSAHIQQMLTAPHRFVNYLSRLSPQELQTELQAAPEDVRRAFDDFIKAGGGDDRLRKVYNRAAAIADNLANDIEDREIANNFNPRLNQ